MSEDRAFVGIDIGTSSVKVGLLAGDSYRVVTRRAGLTTSAVGAAEQDARMLWVTVTEAIRGVLRASGGPRVEAVGLSGHSPSLVAATLSGDPLTPVITWMDRRPLEDGRRSGCRDSAGPDCGAVGDGPSFEATALWIARLPECRGDSEKALLQPKDFIALRLTDRACIDSSSASCFRWYDGAKGWNVGRDLAVAGLLPSVVLPWEACGVVTAEAARATGLPAGIPVASGGIDAVMEALGAGLVEAEAACDATGTSTCVSVVGPAEKCLGGSIRHVAPGRLINVAPVSYTGGSLEWALSVLYPGEHGATRDWSRLIAKANASSRPGACGLLFVPHLVGRRSPKVDPHARGAFVGLAPGHTRADMLRAVLEGCAYAVRESLEAMSPRMSSAQMVREVRAVGSGARHDPWLQIKADVLGVAYSGMAVTEGAVLGAAILAGYCCGAFTSIEEAAGRFVRKRRIFEPRDEACRVYEAMYQAYREASAGLGLAQETLAGIRS